MTRAVGVDGARVDGAPGWIAALVADGRLETVEFHASLTAVVENAPDAEVVAVDVPIGHDDPSGGERGGRRLADVRARTSLGDRSASVFPIPPIDLLEAEDHAAASRQADERGTIAPTVQVWAMREQILEAHRLRKVEDRLVEVHPEVSFHVMGLVLHDVPARLDPKRTWDGIGRRLELLEEAGLEPPATLEGQAGRARPDDVLDAAAAAWSGARVARGEAIAVPHQAPTDPGTGAPVRIQA